MADSRRGKRKVEDDGEAQLGKQAGGMAWGPSRALESAQSKSKNDDEIGFGDFGRYMSEKIRKLRVQFHGDASNTLLSGANSAVAAQHAAEGPLDVAATGAPSGSLKRLFEGVSIYVDGFTIPSHQELRHLMLQYGGIFENYFSRSRVTHVICSTLPDSKIKDPRLLSRGLPIVKPSWIVDSIKAGKRLSLASYELERIVYQHPHQRTLSTTYFAPKDHAVSEDRKHLEDISEPRENPVDVQSHENSDEVDKHIPMKTGELHMDIGEIEHIVDDEIQEDDDPLKEEVHGVPGVGCNAADLRGGLFEEQSIHAEENVPFPAKDGGAPQVASDVKINLSDRQGSTVRKFSEIKEVPSKNHSGHSTLGDPNFVQNYYKYSRLHFIGTWRNRYKDLFGVNSVHLESKEQNLADPSANPAIIHIDMDCFFVAVAIRDRPEFSDKPVAVCHSASTLGTAEISSANYPARAYGITAGMFVKTAKSKCPHLAIVPYDFEGYEQVAEQVYRILHQHSKIVQAVSCDEAYVDVTGLGDPDAIAAAIRQEIFDATKCTASAGIGGNMLLARLATKRAKPNGLHHILPNEVEQFIATLSVGDLPGVGWSLNEKLKGQGISTCDQLRICSKEALQRDFGSKTGNMLWCYAQGIDERQVQPPQERKSIGAEVNWGVRFSGQKDAQHFLVKLCGEVSERLRNAGVLGRTFTLKIKKRKEGVGEPMKFMGCGICDSMSRSATIASATDTVDVLLRATRKLFASFNLDVCEVRGVGLQVTKLEAVKSGCTSGGGLGQRALESWLQVQKSPEAMKGKSAVKTLDPEDIGHQADPYKQQTLDDANLKSLEGSHSGAKPAVEQVPQPERFAQGLRTRLGLPPVSQLDRTVLDCLPADILSEIQYAYSGELGSTSKQGPNLPRKDPSNGANCPEASSSRNDFAVNEETVARVTNLKIDGNSVEVSSMREQRELHSASPEPKPREMSETTVPPQEGRIEALPPASQLDHGVLSALPLTLRRELEHEYKRLSDQVADPPNAKRSSTSLARIRKKGVERQKAPRLPQGGAVLNRPTGRRHPTGVAGSRPQAPSNSSQFMPTSLTQVDMDVLNELPDDLKREVMQILPAHVPPGRGQVMRTVKGPPDVISGSDCSLEALPPNQREGETHLIQPVKALEPSESGSPLCDLWYGHPPKWVVLFEDQSVASSAMLRFLALQYHEGQSRLSSILLSLVSFICSEAAESIDQGGIVAELCSEWVRQYSELQARDLEELHTVLQLIKRLASRSKVWEAVKNQAVAAVQVTVGEVYGAKLFLE